MNIESFFVLINRHLIYRSLPCAYLLLFVGATAYAQSDVQQLRKGHTAYQQGEYAIAEQYYNRAANGKLAAQAFFNTAAAQYQQQQYDKATQNATQAAQQLDKPTIRANAYYNAANALLKAQKTTESIAAYKNALRQNPNDADAKYNLSYALKQQQNQQDNNKQQGDNNEQTEQQNQQGDNNEQTEQQGDNNKQQGDNNKQTEQQNQQGDNNEQTEQQNQQGDNNKQQGDNNKQTEQQNQQDNKQPQNGQESKGATNPTDAAQLPNGTIKRMTKQEAARLLEAMRLEELKVQQRVRQSQAKGKTANKGGKDW